ncbi:MAG: hypothetical protein RIR26_461 [Pseudomonadota bacterium]
MRIFSSVVFFVPLLLTTVQGCVVASGEIQPRNTLFGGSSRAGRTLTSPPPSAPGTLPGLTNRSHQNLENVAPGGAVMPQLSSALAGNSGNTGGFSQPMFTAPLLFQRLDRNTWRVATPAPLLYQTIAKILSQTYINAKADRQTLSLSTEWDKFFIDGRLFRNRVSINVFPLNQKNADLVIKNNIEYYTQSEHKVDENTPTQWLPTQDITDEMERILEKAQKQLVAQMSYPAAR